MGDEAAELEASLVAQLVEQRESLVAIAEALRRDAASEELEEVRTQCYRHRVYSKSSFQFV
jgi:hypothetical protein